MAVDIGHGTSKSWICIGRPGVESGQWWTRKWWLGAPTSTTSTHQTPNKQTAPKNLLSLGTPRPPPRLICKYANTSVLLQKLHLLSIQTKNAPSSLLYRFLCISSMLWKCKHIELLHHKLKRRLGSKLIWWFRTICFVANCEGGQCTEYIKIIGGSGSQHCNEFYNVSSFQQSSRASWTVSGWYTWW